MNHKILKQTLQTSNNMLDIESKDRLSSKTINNFSNKPQLLDLYLKTSIENTFSELIFRLTSEKYNEKRAHVLWNAILKHRDKLNKKLGRDAGILVATLDYLTNKTHIISSPKITHDQNMESTAKIATTDPLTGIYSRNIFDISLEKEINKSIRYQKDLSLIIIDIDDFKNINDTYGHQEGDKVIIRLVQIIKKNLRKSDLLARYGGEEFAVIMPETHINKALIVAERIRLDALKHLDKKSGFISTSIGVSTLSETVFSAYDFIKCADDALYSAKQSGKNCVKSL